jgi:2,5-diketo-D-gluconate reductase A
MPFVELHTGRRMPALGLGTWELTSATAKAVADALELGYRMIDTSGDYGTQPGVGEGVRGHGADRSTLFVVTKVEEDEDAFEAARKNVAELGLEYADLILIHRPPENGVGRELWKGLMRARDEGLARDIGVSNYDVDQIEELTRSTGELPAVNQIEWSPFGHSERMRMFCRERGIVIQAYSPLTRTERLDDEPLVEIARRHGKSPAQVLIRWSLQSGAVPLPKASRAEHRRENLDVFDFRLGDEDMARLDALNEHYSALGELAYE